MVGHGRQREAERNLKMFNDLEELKKRVGILEDKRK